MPRPRPRPLLSAVTALALLAVGLVTAPAQAAPQTAAALLGALPVAPDTTASYSREAFGGWVDADRDGCDTRAEVLRARSGVPVVVGAGCTVVSGRWLSVADGVTWTQASDVDVDHHVPLAEAWRSGAGAWTPAQRVAYANDLDEPAALVPMTDELNQSKGDRDPAAWLPPRPEATCRYAVDWVTVKWRWSLTVDAAEAAALATLLGGACGETVVEVVRPVGPPVVPEPSTPQPPVPAPATNALAPGVALRVGQGLVSASGAYALTLGTDGNAVLRPSTGSGLWSTRTAGRDGVRLVLRRDGALCLYSSTGLVVWTSGTAGSGAVRLALGNDGGLKLQDARGAVVWSTAARRDRLVPDQYLLSGKRVVSAAGRYRLTVQPDGNAAVRTVDGSRVLWSSRTAGRGGVRLKLAGGRVSMLTAAGTTVWSAGSRGSGADRLVVKDDGRLVLATPRGTVLWSTPRDPALTPPPAPAPAPTPPPAPAPAPPADPGNTRNCSDFATWSQAQTWFRTYLPFFGDVAGLDADGDLIACESLPGAP